MPQQHRLVGGVAAGIGCLSLAVPFVVLSLGPSAFARYNDPSSGSFLFRHGGDILFLHGFFGLAMSTVLVFGGLGLYHGRSVGFTILKSGLGLQVLYFALVEVGWFADVLTGSARSPEGAFSTLGVTVVVVAAGLGAVLGLVFVWWLISRLQREEE